MKAAGGRPTNEDTLKAVRAALFGHLEPAPKPSGKGKPRTLPEGAFNRLVCATVSEHDAVKHLLKLLRCERLTPKADQALVDLGLKFSLQIEGTRREIVAGLAELAQDFHPLLDTRVDPTKIEFTGPEYSITGVTCKPGVDPRVRRVTKVTGEENPGGYSLQVVNTTTGLDGRVLSAIIKPSENGKHKTLVEACHELQSWCRVMKSRRPNRSQYG